MRRIRRDTMSSRAPRSSVAPWLFVALATLIASTSLAEDERPARLDPPGAQSSNPSTTEGYRARGTDPAGPRELVLWRWHENGFTRLASTRSRPDGRFDFGEQPLPAVETWFHVAPHGVEPEAEGLVRIERRLRAPRVLPDGQLTSSIYLVPAADGGEFRIYDATSGRLLLRRDIEPRDRPSDALDLQSELPSPPPSAITIEQVLDDGRRSERTYWRIE